MSGGRRAGTRGARERVRRGIGAGLAIGAAALVLALGGSARADEAFSYNPPGMLLPGSGEGRVDEFVYAPGMRFPIEEGAAYLNSQVWGHGGSQGPGGGQCAPENRQYPWWDNYCETRTWDMPLCPSGTGHQGQDLRAATCEDDVHWVVAAADGEITSIGSYTVYLTTDDGTRFDYLHMSSVQVTLNQQVKRGDRLGKVSNAFGGTPTTLHLHFNIRQNVAGVGLVFVPPYMSLVTSYQDLANDTPEGELASATCERVRGASFDPDAPDAPNDVRVAIGGAWDEPGVLTFDVAADKLSESYCEEGAAPCAHGFDAFLPVSLLDGSARRLHLYALDTSEGIAPVELAGSPVDVACSAYSIGGDARRALDGDGAFASWGFSLMFDQLPAAPGEVAALAEGQALPAAPSLVASAAGDGLWIVDGAWLRSVSPDAARAFRFDAAGAAVWSTEELAAAKYGEPWPERPVLVRGDDQALYLLDAGAEIPFVPGPKDSEPDDEDDAAAKVSCSCRTTSTEGSPSGGWMALLAACAVAARALRRRTRASGKTPGLLASSSSLGALAFPGRGAVGEAPPARPTRPERALR